MASARFAYTNWRSKRPVEVIVGTAHGRNEENCIETFGNHTNRKPFAPPATMPAARL